MVGRERAIIFEGSVGDDGSPDVSTCMSSRCWDSGVARVVLMGGGTGGRKPFVRAMTLFLDYKMQTIYLLHCTSKLYFNYCYNSEFIAAFNSTYVNNIEAIFSHYHIYD